MIGEQWLIFKKNIANHLYQKYGDEKYLIEAKKTILHYLRNMLQKNKRQSGNEN